MTKFIDLIKENKEPKKTIFNHYFDGINWITAIGKADDFDTVVCLGKDINDSEMDIFACYENNDCIPSIYKGVKGNEFD